MPDDPKPDELEKHYAPGKSIAEIREMCRKSIDKGLAQHDGEPKRFEEGEGVEDVVDDSALED
jgi:hypothetical protein